MVNWKRVFEQIWQQIRWLISFGQINELAFKKILKKFVKNFFAIKDNTIKSRLSQIIDSKSFQMVEGDKTQAELKMLSDSLLTFYADVFHKGNKSEARGELNAQHNQIRNKDMAAIAFSLGSCFMLVCLLLFYWLTPPDIYSNPTGWNSFFFGEDTFIFLFIMTWVVFATSVAIQVFRRYGINYTFIFEIDQNYKLIHHQLYRVGLILFSIWFGCLVFQIGMIKIDVVNPTWLQFFPILCAGLFALICFCPLHCFYMRTRKHIWITMWHIIISPFGLVRFRHFFLADVLTSIVTPLQMLGVIECWYFGPGPDWKVP